MTTAEGGWLLEVSDAAADSGPVLAVGRGAALGGLGLFLVAQLSSSHGWSAQDDGRKVVWARLDFTGELVGPISVPADEAAISEPAPTGGTDARPTPPRRVPRGQRQSPRALPRQFRVAVTAVVLALALVLGWLAATANAHSNQRLLQQQVDQAATLLRTQLAVLQTPMTDAGQVADATAGRPAPFHRFAAAAARMPGTSLSL